MDLHLLHTGPLRVNTYIVPIFENKVFIVDPANCAFSHDEGSLLSYLESNKLDAVAIILTHGHFDHVSGLPALKKSFPNIPIAIHKNDSGMIGPSSQVEQGAALAQMGFEAFLPFVSNLPEAAAFLEDGKSLAQVFESLDLADDVKSALENWQVLHTPGHTEGSCCLYNENEHVLISGDTLFYRSWGRTDLIGGNERKIHQSLAKILEECDEETLVYPGHEHTGFAISENY